MYGGFFLAATLVQYVTDYDVNTKHCHWETQGQTRNSSVKIQLLFFPWEKVTFYKVSFFNSKRTRWM